MQNFLALAAFSVCPGIKKRSENHFYDLQIFSCPATRVFSYFLFRLAFYSGLLSIPACFLFRLAFFF